jgi:hypothetical protein
MDEARSTHDMKNAHEVLAETWSEEPLGRLKLKWKVNIKINPKTGK